MSLDQVLYEEYEERRIMRKKWKYHWCHIPGTPETNLCGCEYKNAIAGTMYTQSEMGEISFLRLLDFWNAASNGHWHYWSASE